MKLTILGNNGPYPAAGGACSGYLLTGDHGRTQVLIDCGAGVLSGLSTWISWEALDAVILSHLHYDHMSDLLPMQYAMQFHPRPAPLPVFAPATPAPVRALLDVPAYDLRPMEEIATVSYTHLDVYKRQGELRSAGPAQSRSRCPAEAS